MSILINQIGLKLPLETSGRAEFFFEGSADIAGSGFDSGGGNNNFAFIMISPTYLSPPTKNIQIFLSEFSKINLFKT